MRARLSVRGVCVPQRPRLHTAIAALLVSRSSKAYRLRPMYLCRAVAIDRLIEAEQGGRGQLRVRVRRPVLQDPKVPIGVATATLWRGIPREVAHRPPGSTLVPALWSPADGTSDAAREGESWRAHRQRKEGRRRRGGARGDERTYHMACIFPPRSLSIAVHLAGVRPLPLAWCDSQALHFTCRGGRGGDGGGGCGGGGDNGGGSGGGGVNGPALGGGGGGCGGLGGGGHRPFRRQSSAKTAEQI